MPNPSIRVYALPAVANAMVYPNKTTLKVRLSAELRKKVASSLGYDVSDVEVIWIPVDFAVNAGPLNIEVLYSVKPDFNPDEKTRVTLAQELADMVARLDWLPKCVYEVTSWILPQHDAVFKVAPRSTK